MIDFEACDAYLLALLREPECGPWEAVHATVVGARGGKRINDRHGVRWALCGSQRLTAYDVLLATAQREPERVECVACRSLLRGQSVTPSRIR